MLLTARDGLSDLAHSHSLSGRHLYVVQSAHPVSYLELSNARQVQHDGLSPPSRLFTIMTDSEEEEVVREEDVVVDT